MDYSEILKNILNLGSAMIASGAETHRVEDSLYRLCNAYKFTDSNIWVVLSNIQATITAPDSTMITQVRHVRKIGADFDMLDRLNSVSRKTCADTPDEKVFAERIREATSDNRLKRWVRYPAAVLAGAGFGIFFNCDYMDAITAAAVALIITVFGRFLGKRESNPLIFNFIMSFAAEIFILFAVRMGLGHHTGYITVGVVMLLISALGTTNGIKDLVHLDTISGVINITSSFTGAVGIALGIAVPILLLPSWSTVDPIGLNTSAIITMITATIGCTGFALFFNVLKPAHILTCAAGAALTWGAYLLSCLFIEGTFVPVIIGSAVCALFSLVMARVNKAPATIFQTICIFPLIPGSALYYTAYGVVTGSAELTRSMGFELVSCCFAIVLGFMTIEALNRLIKKA